MLLKEDIKNTSHERMFEVLDEFLFKEDIKDTSHERIIEGLDEFLFKDLKEEPSQTPMGWWYFMTRGDATNPMGRKKDLITNKTPTKRKNVIPWVFGPWKFLKIIPHCPDYAPLASHRESWQVVGTRSWLNQNKWLNILLLSMNGPQIVIKTSYGSKDQVIRCVVSLA